MYSDIILKLSIILAVFTVQIIAFRSIFNLPMNKLRNMKTLLEMASSDSKSNSGSRTASEDSVTQSFVDQKNFLLLQKLREPENGMSTTEAASQYVNFCDEGFNTYLDDMIANAQTSDEKNDLGRIRYELNSARQKKLMEADKILRDILASGDLKMIEAKLQMYLRKAEIDMAFIVILQLNIQDAVEANAEKAVQIMTHLETLITEYQDNLVSPPVRLLRMLIRAEDSNIRKQMLRQKLLGVGGNSDIKEDNNNDSGTPQAQDTTVPQCEHIIVNAVEKWGGAEVTVDQLVETIDDVVGQMTDMASGGTGTPEDSQARDEFEAKCELLRRELFEVIQESNNNKEKDNNNNRESAITGNSNSNE